MNWFQKHADTVIVLGGILASVLWMTHKLSDIEKDIVMIKTVMIVQKIMPPELCIKKEKNEQSN